MTLPVFDRTPEGVDGPSYTVAHCAVAGCRMRPEYTRSMGRIDPHHLVRRSAHGKPKQWIRLEDGRVVGNIVGLCVRHHDDLTSPVGGHRNAIRYRAGLFWWCEVISDGRGSVDYRAISELDPQPPSRDDLDEAAHSHEAGTDVCPTCGQATRAEARPARSTPGEPPRPRKTWTVKVPDDSEDGAEVLDVLVDDLAPVLGYESSPNLRYYTLARVLAFAQQSKRELLEMSQ